MRRSTCLVSSQSAYKYTRVWPRQRLGNCGPIFSSLQLVCFHQPSDDFSCLLCRHSSPVFCFCVRARRSHRCGQTPSLYRHRPPLSCRRLKILISASHRHLRFSRSTLLAHSRSLRNAVSHLQKYLRTHFARSLRPGSSKSVWQRHSTPLAYMVSPVSPIYHIIHRLNTIEARSEGYESPDEVSSVCLSRIDDSEFDNPQP